MTIAITGGDGAVGRALQRIMAARSMPFRALVSSEPEIRISSVGEHIVGDETDAATVEKLTEGADVLIHLGRTKVSPADDFCQEELFGQATVIPVAHKRGIELHFLSTSEVFPPLRDPSAQAIGENAPVEPSSPLGVAKLAWEHTLRIWGEQKGLRHVIYRVPLVVPEFLSYSNACARYLRAGFKTGEISPQSGGDGRCGMCYVHAEDAARLIVDTIGRTEAVGQTFHVAAEQWLSEEELAEISYRVLRDFMIPCKWRSAQPDSPLGLVGDVWLDSAKARRLLALDTSNSVPRLVTKLRLWVDDFGSTARLPIAK